MDDLIIVQGEFITRLIRGEESTTSSVIIQIVCKNQQDAEDVLKKREGLYKNLIIKSVNNEELYGVRDK